MEFCIDLIPEMFYHTFQEHLIIWNKNFNYFFLVLISSKCL